MNVTLGDSEISIKEIIILETGMFSFFVATNGEAKRVRRWGTIAPMAPLKDIYFSMNVPLLILKF